MEKDLEPWYEHYVCDNCFKPVMECECFGGHMPCYLVHIDKDLQPAIEILNRKGYTTKHCCAGHKPDDRIYIMFYKSLLFADGNTPMPKSFALTGKNMIEWKPDERPRDTPAYWSMRENAFADLMDWCNSLEPIGVGAVPYDDEW